MMTIKQLESMIEIVYFAFLERGISKDDAEQAVNTIQMHMLNEEMFESDYLPILNSLDVWLVGILLFSDYDREFFRNLHKLLGGSYF